jgi:hypothetical protein
MTDDVRAIDLKGVSVEISVPVLYFLVSIDLLDQSDHYPAPTLFLKSSLSRLSSEQTTLSLK